MEHLTVSSLARSGIQVVPEEYKRSFDPVALSETPEEQVPVINLSGLTQGAEQRALVVEAVARALRDWGIFQVVGHGVAADVMDRMQQLVHSFFSMKQEDQLKYFSDDLSKTFRFGTSLIPTSKMKLWVDYLAQVYPPKEDEVPGNLPDYLEVTTAYAEEVARLAKSLVGCLSESLGLESPSLLEKWMEKQYMRMNYYPPCPDPSVAIGSSEHTDFGVITVLQQVGQVHGLQALRQGKWINVVPLEGAFVVNIGDTLEVVTNGTYKSVIHRALVNKASTRVSLATFFMPCEGTSIAPLEELVNAGDTVKYRVRTFGEYMKSYFEQATKPQMKLLDHVMRY